MPARLSCFCLLALSLSLWPLKVLAQENNTALAPPRLPESSQAPSSEDLPPPLLNYPPLSAEMFPNAPRHPEKHEPPIQHQFPLHNQPPAEEGLQIEATGFIRWDGLFNTRQSVAAREGLLYFYPKPIALNEAGQDLNADPEINMLSIFTRGALKINVPDVWGARLFGLVEADFFGHLNSTISNLRLRHAYIDLDWETLQIRLGQYWSPFTQVDFFPGIMNPGVGQPVQPFSRNPGIFVTWQPVSHLQLEAATHMQRDAFSEFGARNTLQQASGLPAGALNLTYLSEQFKLGVGAMGKAIRPAPTEENLFSGGLQLFASYLPINDLRLRGRLVWGSNLADHQMLGGFVETEDHRFLNLSTWSSWLDLEYRFAPQWRLGLFGGYAANLGTLEALSANDEPLQARNFVARDPNQAWSWFLVPRLVFDPTPNLRFALEMHWAESLYASSYTRTLAPDPQRSDKSVHNLHLAFSSMLLF